MFPFFSDAAAFAVRYLISNYDVALLPVLLIRSDSPRVYVSTNPWMVTSTFQTVSSTREEYIALIGILKASAPTKPKSKVEFAHQNLILTLEGRLEAIDKESMVSPLRGVLDDFLLCFSLCRILPISHVFLAGTAGTQKG